MNKHPNARTRGTNSISKAKKVRLWQLNTHVTNALTS